MASLGLPEVEEPRWVLGLELLCCCWLTAALGLGK